MSFECLDLTLPDPHENIALDEALLENRGQQGGEPLLRLWEPVEPLVVIGRSSRYQTEVNLSACMADNVPFIRRCSGGAAVVASSGCLMYAVLLPYDRYPELRSLDVAHQFVMTNVRAAVENLGLHVEMQGTCDLTYRNRKFSGNAMRATRDWLLYHGTVLCSMDLELISKYLGQPERQPDYRKKRPHEDFVTSIPVSTEDVKTALVESWGATKAVEEYPMELTKHLAESKYRLDEWNRKR